MTVDNQLEDIRLRILKLETTLEGLFRLLTGMSIETDRVKQISRELVQKHGILVQCVSNVEKEVVQLKGKGNDSTNTKEKD